MRKLIPFLLLFVSNFYCSDIFIDIGHNKNNYGTTSSTCVGEFEYNKELAKYIQENTKLKINLSRNVNNDLIDFKERYENSKHGNIFISIHHDSVQEYDLLKDMKCFTTNKASGFSILISKKNKDYDKSYLFAKLLGDALLKEGFKVNTYHNSDIKGENKVFINKELGIYEYDDLAVLKNTFSPSILLEAGVISNPEEEQIIKTTEFKSKISRAIQNSYISYQKILSN
jgi:N-acetylmuramoyl-L-alanine amidase